MLIRLIQKDIVVREKVIELLKLDPYHRRSGLNNWLDQLRQKQASKDILEAISCLSDDIMTEEVIVFIKKSFKNKK